MTNERLKYLTELETKIMASNLKGAYVMSLNEKEDSIPTLLVMTLPKTVATMLEMFTTIHALKTSQWVEYFFCHGIDAVCEKYNLNDPQARKLLYKDAAQVAKALTEVTH